MPKGNRNGPGSMNDSVELENEYQLMGVFKVAYDNFQHANEFLIKKRAPVTEHQRFFDIAFQNSVRQIMGNPNFKKFVVSNGGEHAVWQVVGTMFEVLKANNFRILPEVAIQISVANTFGYGNNNPIDPRRVQPKPRF